MRRLYAIKFSLYTRLQTQSLRFVCVCALAPNIIWHLFVCSSGFLWRRAFLWRNQICCFKLALKDQWCKSLFIKSSSAFTSIARELQNFRLSRRPTRVWNHSLVAAAVLAPFCCKNRFYAITIFHFDFFPQPAHSAYVRNGLRFR